MVLGVEDGDHVTFGQSQAIVERLGLGPRLGGRHDHQLELWAGIGVDQCAQRLLIILFDQQEDLEPTHWVVEAGNVLDQVVDDRGFPVGRNQNGVERQILLAHRERLFVGDDLHHVTSRRPHEQVDAIEHRTDVGQRDEPDDDAHRQADIHDQTDDQQHREQEEDVPLSLRHKAASRQQRHPISQARRACLQSERRLGLIHEAPLHE